MAVKFYLRDPKLRQSTIYGIVHHDAKSLKFQTGLSCSPRQWSPAKQRLKTTAANSDAELINSELDAIEKKLTDYIRQTGSLSRENIATALSAKPQSPYLTDWAMNYARTADKKPRTILAYNVLRLCVRAACRMFQVCTDCQPPDAKPLL